MSIAQVLSRAQDGIDAPLITVEAHVANGLPAVTLVGLPETAVRESRDRVRAAILSAGFEFPPRRLTLNLAPADLPKEGARFDLAIAVAILAVTGQLTPLARERLAGYEWLGELSLDGSLRPVQGALSAAIAARDAGRTLILPQGLTGEVAVVPNVRALAAGHLNEVVAHLAGEGELTPIDHRPRPPLDPAHGFDLADVRGQPRAKRALAIAAAGSHNLLLIGPPGAGKSMLAQRLPGILPPMTEPEALDVARIHSISTQGFDPERFGFRPFRSPHHSASAVALIGGGSHPRPGEISLTHRGVLFLDELPEFDRKVLEALREPLETGRVTISRAARQSEFPADFQLIAAMNPSPQGVELHSPAAQRYRAKISGPLLDRIDMHLDVPRVSADQLSLPPDTQDSAAIRAQVAPLETTLLRLLNQAIEKLQLSGRARDRILKLARTIADLDGKTDIDHQCLTEAIGYRNLDRLFR